MKIEMPGEVKRIISALCKRGFEAFIVGGCVRDRILNLEPKDWDVTTSASPKEVIELFEGLGYKTVPTGIKHGTVTVMVGSEGFEVTTYRIDGKYTDNRRPDEVTFTTSLKEDLSRRDFTMNALAYNDEQGLIDYFGGEEDIRKKVIRCVGSAQKRFEEDALRMLRAVRFAVKLGFKIDGETKDAIVRNADSLKFGEPGKGISPERKATELDKILMSDNPSLVKLLVQFDVMKHIVPQFMGTIGLGQDNPHHVFTVDEHIYKALENSDKELAVRYAVLLHDIGKSVTKTTDEKGIDHFYRHASFSAEMAKEALKVLKKDNNLIDSVVTAVEFHDAEIPLSKASVRRWINKIGVQNFENIIKVSNPLALAMGLLTSLKDFVKAIQWLKNHVNTTAILLLMVSSFTFIAKFLDFK